MREVALLPEPEAEADLRTAFTWHAARSDQAAAGFDAAVEVALRTIAETPGRWTRCDPRHRSYVLRRYPSSIVYRIEAEGILVDCGPPLPSVSGVVERSDVRPQSGARDCSSDRPDVRP